LFHGLKAVAFSVVPLARDEMRLADVRMSGQERRYYRRSQIPRSFVSLSEMQVPFDFGPSRDLRSGQALRLAVLIVCCAKRRNDSDASLWMTFSFLTRVVVVRAESPEAEKPAGNWQAFSFSILSSEVIIPLTHVE
jgi:hypothetical protein